MDEITRLRNLADQANAKARQEANAAEAKKAKEREERLTAKVDEQTERAYEAFVAGYERAARSGKYEYYHDLPGPLGRTFTSEDGDDYYVAVRVANKVAALVRSKKNLPAQPTLSKSEMATGESGPTLYYVGVKLSFK